MKGPGVHQFVLAYFTNDNLLFLFVLKKKDVWGNVKTFAVSYDFVLRKDR
jgi:hypothetical protein